MKLLHLAGAIIFGLAIPLLTQTIAPTVAVAGSDRRVVGRWRHYTYSGGYYVRGQYAGTGYYTGRTETAVIDYTFNSDGTFKILVPKSNLGSGTYRIIGNTLKMTYSNGTVKQYSYVFEEHPETIYRYILLTEVGAARSFPRLQSEGNK
jgi:Family of unknown function (DUF5640)